MSEHPTDTALPEEPRAKDSDQTSSPQEGPLPRTFGLKDLFTCINLFGGVFTIIFSLEGNLRHAAYAFLIGFFADSLDGLVARLTHTGNRFGAQFDAISDHLTQCVAPASIVYVGYRDIDFFLASGMAALLILTGSIRHARAAVSPVNFPIAYMGLPRTASSFIVVSFLNSSLFIDVPGGRWLGIPMLVILSLAHILPLPFRTHKGRKLQLYVRIAVFLFFASTIVSLLFFPRYVFDVTFFWLTVYVFTAWIPLSKEERRAFFARAREWRMEIRRAR